MARRGSIIVPASPLYAEAKIFSEAIETKNPHSIIGHVVYDRPILKGSFSVLQRMAAVLLWPIDRGAARYLPPHRCAQVEEGLREIDKL
jgi:hypothetical protein